VPIRTLRPEEFERYKALETQAFVITDLQRYNEWVESRVKPSPESVWVLEEDGEIKTQLRIIYPRLWLGQGTVAMAGITSVATPPEYRRQGHLKKLLTAVLHDLHESGYGISTLYPFSFPFYKKFGYEQASTRKNISVKIDALQKFKSTTGGHWKQATVAQWEEFNQIYEKLCQGKFGPISRDKQIWEGFFKGWGGKGHTSYLWHDKQGQPQAYIIYSFEEPKDSGREINVTTMGWTNRLAFYELLAFLANHDSQARKVNFSLSPSEDFFALLDDPRQAEIELNPGYMLRILDVARALEERAWQEDLKGTFSMVLRDDGLEWNNRAVQIEVANGKAQVKPLTDVDKAGLSCDIRQLSQLYAGYLSPFQLNDLGLLEVHNRQDLLVAQQIFSPSGQPASHMMDYF
jgi:predicted acetyltransferase